MPGEVYRCEDFPGLIYDVEGPSLKATLSATVSVYRLDGDDATLVHSDRLTLDRQAARVRFADAAGTDPDDLVNLREWIIAQLTAEPERPGVADEADPEEGVPEDGDVLLSDVAAFLSRYVAYPNGAALIAHTLWVLHAHLMDAWDSTPRLAFLSPEPGSGKTRALEASEPLVPRPVEAVNVSAAYLFRKVDDAAGRPTILFDEVDTVFGPKARGDEDVRGLLNAGHRKGAVAGRCVVREKTVETIEFPAYCAVAMAGLGDLPDTILTRSVVIRMRRRKPTERVQAWRRRDTLPEAHLLYQRIARWAKQVEQSITALWPMMPAGVEDRDADVWEALIAVADAAGGEWPKRARAAAQKLVAEAKRSTPSLGVRLLTDLRSIFGERDSMQTEEILKALCALDESPWGELVAGKPLNSRGLAKRLGAYGIQSANVRQGASVKKGYRRIDLADAWARYLGETASPPPESATSATSDTDADAAREDAESAEDPVAETADDGTDRPLHEADCATENPHHDANVTDVADVAAAGKGSAPPLATNSRRTGRRCVQCPEPAIPTARYCAKHGGRAAVDPEVLAMARAIFALKPAERSAYREELDAAPGDDPKLANDWAAFAIAEQMLAGEWSSAA